MRTSDGKSVFLWFAVFAVLLVRSIIDSGPSLDQLKYLAFSLIVFIIFCQFRVSDFRPELKTNM